VEFFTPVTRERFIKNEKGSFQQNVLKASSLKQFFIVCQSVDKATHILPVNDIMLLSASHLY